MSAQGISKTTEVCMSVCRDEASSAVFKGTSEKAAEFVEYLSNNVQ